MDFKGRRESKNVIDKRGVSKQEMKEARTRMLKNIERVNKNPDRAGWIIRNGEKPDLSKGSAWDPNKDSVYEKWE